MLFILPSMNIRSQNALITNFVYTSFPAGIGFLAGYLRKYNSADITVIDEHIRSVTDQKLIELLGQLACPRIVGLSCLTVTLKRGLELAGKIKKHDSGITVIMGGIHPTVMPEECLAGGVVDIVIRGEGETTVSELYDLIKAGKSYSEIEGISFTLDGKIVHNKPRDLLDNLDMIPEFPYDLFEKDIDKYRDFGTIVTSRGCPYTCIFCSQRAISGGKYRYVSTERSLKEIGLLVGKYKQDKIWFIEDNFGVNKKRIFKLAKGIVDHGYHQKAEFIAELRADSVDRELIARLKEANFTMFVFGSETGSERLMKIVQKRETVEQNNNAIRIAHEYGIKVSTTYIFGLPTETNEERKLTFKLSQMLPLDNVRFNTAIPYPGTYLYELAKAENRLNILQGWENFSVQYYLMGDYIPYYPEGTNKYVLIYETMKANIRTYISIRGIKSMIKSPLSGGAAVSLPKQWTFNDFIKILRLGAFILKRFVYIFYKAKTEIVLKKIYQTSLTKQVK